MHVLLADDDAIRARALMLLLAGLHGLRLTRLQPGQLLADAIAMCAPDVVSSISPALIATRGA